MKDMYREALWQKRGRPRELYPDVSSKDAPVPPELLKGKCALGPFLSILVIECQHKCLNVISCLWMDKVQNKSKGMFLSLSTLFRRLMYSV
jgi:hypothetical protein